MAGSRAFVLVVIANPDLRRLIGRVVEELNLVAILFGEWEASFATLAPRAEAVIVDLDDFEDTVGQPDFPHAAGGTPAPLIAVSRRSNVADVAPRLGAMAGVRKPFDVGLLMATIGGVLQR
jgi:hypothetical protein